MEASTTAALPEKFNLGEYSIESVLGTGGFGITYLARDTKLGTLIAIKEYFPQFLAVRNNRMEIIPKDNRSAQDYRWGLQQFLEEAQALAKFKHNHIVRVLRFLEMNNTAYMVMEYEKGESLSGLLKKQGNNKLDEPSLMRIFVPILNGLQAVHSVGLLHLDIKPDNIYLKEDGQPMLIDFGSARQTAAGPEAAKRIALTPAYAAIEQYPDKGKQGAWTDIYSIGASLYHCISGHPPMDALKRYQAVLKYKTDPMVPTINLKDSSYSEYFRECVDWAMNIYPNHRPRSARELQDGLMGMARPGKTSAPTIAAPQPVAVEDGVEEENATPYQLDPWKLALFGVGALALLGALGIGFALALKKPAVPTPVVQSAVGEPDVKVLSEETEIIDQTEPANSLPIAPTNKPTEAKYSAQTALYKTLVSTTPLYAVAVTKEGQSIFAGGEDGKLYQWNTERGRLQKNMKAHRGAIHAIALSPDGRWLASAGDDYVVTVHHTDSLKTYKIFTGHDYAVYTLAFSRDSKMLASGGKDWNVVVWDLENRKKKFELKGHEDTIMTVAFSHDNNVLASGAKDGRIRYWSMLTGIEVDQLHGHRGWVGALAYSRDGEWMASGGPYGLGKVWGIGKKNKGQRLNLSSSPNTLTALNFTPDSSALIGVGTSNSIYIWKTKSGYLLQELAGHKAEVHGFSLSADGKVLVSASSDKTIRVWK